MGLFGALFGRRGNGDERSPQQTLINMDHVVRDDNSLEQSRKFNREHRVPENEKISYGYKDGGRGMRLDEDGKPINSPSREILVVKSPDEDEVLRAAIDRAKSKIDLIDNIEDKARHLSQFVAKAMPQNNPILNDQIMDEISGGSHVGKEISLGQLIQEGTGVCRHRSLLFKTIADEVGIPSALVRGNFRYQDGLGGGGHAWNEVIDQDGRRILVDVMHDYIGDMDDLSLIHI